MSKLPVFNYEVVAEKWRLNAYLGFWFFVFFARTVTKLFVVDKLNAGPLPGTPANRMGCGPFHFGDEYAERKFYVPDGTGFDFNETNHLKMLFGFANICTAWDYSPSREATAVVYPLFEYSLIVYLCLDYVTTYLAHQRGSIAPWFWNFSWWVFRINIFLCTQFRLIFVFIAYEYVKGHTVGFLGLQISLILVALQNALYVMCTKQKIVGSVETTQALVKIYIFGLSFISAFKITATTYVVLHGEGAPWTMLDTFVPNMPVGRLVDLVWMVFNAILPLIISFLRNKAEKKLQIVITSEEDVGAHESEMKSLTKGGASGGRAKYENLVLDPL